MRTVILTYSDEGELSILQKFAEALSCQIRDLLPIPELTNKGFKQTILEWFVGQIATVSFTPVQISKPTKGSLLPPGDVARLVPLQSAMAGKQVSCLHIMGEPELAKTIGQKMEVPVFCWHWQEGDLVCSLFVSHPEEDEEAFVPFSP